jgi:hypothetical protein
VHRLGNTFSQRQSQAGSVNLRCRDHGAAVEGLENLLQFRAVDPDPVILDANVNLFFARLAVPAKCPNRDLRIRAAVLYRVDHQIL